MKNLLAVVAFLTLMTTLNAHEADVGKDIRTNQEWKEVLTPEQYYILREEGTEKPFSSPLNNEKRDGVYKCAACGLELFTSATKYDSKTGWPSFWDVIPGHVKEKTDWKLIIPRTEYHCARCEGHQGHVFNDGPADKTGLRYCNNGDALIFVAKGEM